MLKRNDVAQKDVELERLKYALDKNILTPEVKANGFGGVDMQRLATAIDQLAMTYKFESKPNGEEIFVIDGHTHLWDGSPANHKNRHGKEFIDCFYDYHRNLSPADYLWPKEKFEKYPLETMVQDLFVDGYDDMAIFQPTYLTDFYVTGFNTTGLGNPYAASVLAARNPLFANGLTPLAIQSVIGERTLRGRGFGQVPAGSGVGSLPASPTDRSPASEGGPADP